MIGQTLGRYRILEKIGSGGMGDVYRAADDRLEREVAIKILKPSLATDPDRFLRFEREARAAATLNHPNIVAIFDVEMLDGSPYIVSELLQGETFRQRMEREPIPLVKVVEYGVQIAEGLEAAHKKRIVHRDLKPENIFLTHDGLVKILDFGIAKLLASSDPGDSSLEDFGLRTKPNFLLGTICYMSPEQLRGKPVDQRSDIFSCGAILYEMLTQTRAFAGETDADTMMSVLQRQPPEMMVTDGKVPHGFERIVQHCLEKEPDDRFQSAQDLGFALRTVSYEPNEVIVATRARSRGWGKWFLCLVAACLVLGTGVLIGIKFRKGESVSYRQLTHQQGGIYSARFSHDGQNIFYGALLNHGLLELYQVPQNGPAARLVGFTSSHMLALSRTNELALATNGFLSRWGIVGGDLVLASLTGNRSAELLKRVPSADWSPNDELAVVHGVAGKTVLEYPIGKILYETTGWISDPRFSPDGKHIAFMDHPVYPDDRGSIGVVDLAGHRTTLASGWKSEGGLAWSPSGDEIWFTAANPTEPASVLWAVDFAGRLRRVLAIPGKIRLRDIATDGRLLITVEHTRLGMELASGDGRVVRDLSWYDFSVIKDISKDGQRVLFDEASSAVGANYSTAVRNVDGSAPTSLSPGSAGGLSPDGKWAISIFPDSPQYLSLVPVGPGEERKIFLPELEHLIDTYFLGDGKHVIVEGSLPGRPSRDFIVDLSATRPRPLPITAEDHFVYTPSSDGKYLVSATGDGDDLELISVRRRSSRAIPISKNAGVLGWSADSKSLYVVKGSEGIPLKIYRAEIATGKLTLLTELTPSNRAGVLRINSVVTTPEASKFVYSYEQNLSTLYVVSGVH